MSQTSWLCIIITVTAGKGSVTAFTGSVTAFTGSLTASPLSALWSWWSGASSLCSSGLKRHCSSSQARDGVLLHHCSSGLKRLYTCLAGLKCRQDHHVWPAYVIGGGILGIIQLGFIGIGKFHLHYSTSGRTFVTVSYYQVGLRKPMPPSCKMLTMSPRAGWDWLLESGREG